jgi:glycosyltransferase involved in cell wall biosynthesis
LRLAGVPAAVAHNALDVRSIDRPITTLQIGYIIASNGAPMTGSERYYFELIRALIDLGFPTRGIVLGDFAAGDPRMRFVESFASEKVAGRRGRIASLRRAVRREAPAADVVATHSSEHAYPVLDLVGRKPLVVHFHGPRALEYAAEGKSRLRVAFARAGELLVYRRASRCIALSRANADTLRTAYGVPEARIRIVPGAVDTARFHPGGTRDQARAALGWPADRPIVVAVRRLAPTKGIEELVDAVARLRSAVPRVFVALVGAGPLRASLEHRVAALDLEDNIVFTGQLDATLPDAYRAADVSVVPSVALEGFGLSVIESLACGTPALVTPVTGLPEVVRDLDPRLVMADATAAGIANALERALLSPHELTAAAACASYAQRFAWPTIAARVAGVYAEALAERRGPR